MTSMVTSRQTPTMAVPGPRAVQAAATAVLEAMTAAGPDDPRWEHVGPLVSAAALRLREALGSHVEGSCVGSPAIVRERDFAVAARGLLAREVRIVDGRAARDYVRLAFDAAVALS